MATLQKRYSDIDFTFTKHPVTKDIVIGFDDQAVIRSVRNLLLTNHYEVPFNSSIGSNVRRLLFEQITPLTANILKREIEDTINNYEPRVNLTSVLVNALPDENFYRVTLTFYLVNKTEPITINFVLERLR